MYSGRKITESLGNVTVKGEKDGTSKGKPQRQTVCPSMYSITENIYYSQLSSVALLLQPEPVSHHIIQINDCVLSLSLSVLSSCRLHLPPTCLLLTANEARSYFASSIQKVCFFFTRHLQSFLAGMDTAFCIPLVGAPSDKTSMRRSSTTRTVYSFTCTATTSNQSAEFSHP
jgi:hypothetical protein